MKLMWAPASWREPEASVTTSVTRRSPGTSWPRYAPGALLGDHDRNVTVAANRNVRELEGPVLEIPAGLAVQPILLRQCEAERADPGEVVGQQLVECRCVSASLGGRPFGEKPLDVIALCAHAASPLVLGMVTLKS